MKILISPTKTMRNSGDHGIGLPENIENAKKLVSIIRKLDKQEVMEKMKINSKIAESVIDMYKNIKFDTKGSSAISSFDGLQYKRLDYNALTDKAKKYIHENVYIYTGLYGLIKSNDSIYPHRLDFNMKFSLYDFWGKTIADQLDEDEVIIDASSNEFMKVVHKYRRDNYYRVFFKEKDNNKFYSKSTPSKIMRGLFVRYMAENNIKDIDEMLQFDIDGYSFYEITDEGEIIFVKEI